MQVKSISASGLKVPEFKHKLGAMTIFRGPNRSGKTARLEAVRLALAGYVPELGKQPGATFQLANGDSLIVQADLSDGRTLIRKWAKNGKGVKAKDNETAAGFAVPPVMLDPQVFLGLGPKDRMRHLFDLAHIEDSNAAKQVIDLVLATNWDEENKVAAIKAVGPAVKDIEDSDYSRHDQGQPVQEWLAELAELAKGKVKGFKDALDRMTSTIAGLAVMQGNPPADVTAELEKAREELQAVVSAAGWKSAQLASAKIQAERRKRLQHVINSKPGPTGEAALLADVEHYKMAIDACPSVDVTRALTEKLHEAREWAGKTTLGYNLANNEVDRHTKELGRLDSLIVCPTCGAKGDNWKDARRAELRQLIQDAETKQAATKKANDDAFAALNDALKDSELNSAARDRSDVASARLRIVMEKLNAMSQARRDAEHAQEELDAMGPMDTTALETAFAEVQAQKREAEAKVNRLVQAADAFAAHQNTERLRANALIERGDVEAQAAVWKAVLKAAETVQVTIADQVFGGLMDAVNRVVGPALGITLRYMGTDLGYMAGGKFVSHETFSGSEKAVVYAALGLALAAQSPVKLFMLDELGRFDRTHRDALLDSVRSMIRDGVLDQFIGAEADGDGELEAVTVTVE